MSDSNRKTRNKIRSMLFAGTVIASFAYPPSAFAAATTPVGGFVSAAGIAVGVVGGGGALGYGIATDNGWLGTGGFLGLVGGGALILFDPPAATLYSGSFSLHYDPYFLSLHEVGWLGDWGVDPNLAAPPVDPNQWNGVTVYLQSPANGLNATISNDSSAGLLTVDFNWPNGKPSVSDSPFNMFGAVFNILRPVIFTNLGDFTAPPAGANLYATSSGISCTIGSSVLQTCGESKTTYFQTSGVPEPSTWALMLAGFAGLGIASWRSATRKNRVSA